MLWQRFEVFSCFRPELLSQQQMSRSDYFPNDAGADWSLLDLQKYKSFSLVLFEAKKWISRHSVAMLRKEYSLIRVVVYSLLRPAQWGQVIGKVKDWFVWSIVFYHFDAALLKNFDNLLKNVNVISMELSLKHWRNHVYKLRPNSFWNSMTRIISFAI